MRSKSSLATGLLLAFSPLAFASTTIGTVSAAGSLRVDGYAVTGSATLFDGSAVATAQAPATLRLSAGAQIKLAPASEGTVYRDHMSLNSGKGEIAASGPFVFESSGLTIMPTRGAAHGIVEVMPDKSIQVAALSGDLQVANSGGAVLARIRSGSAMSFAAQPAGGSVTLKGKVSSSGGNYFLTADDGSITQLTGKDFEKYVGKDVRVTGTLVAGTAPAGGASSVLDVTTMSKLAAGAAAGGTGGSGWTGTDIAITAIGGAVLGTAIGWAIYYNTGASR
ncbi:MAG TPA: DUF5818 domain-containing protein [Terracidiphilus sp.]|nr:DUF5818 domain-containing protein [Terracidiphilus sp.]